MPWSRGQYSKTEVGYFPVLPERLRSVSFLLYGIRDAGTTGAAGASAPLAFCIFNFVGAVRVQTMGVTGAHKLLQQTELNVARGCVWGCSIPQSSGIRQSCYPFGERWNGQHCLWNSWREITEELCLNNCIRSEKIWWRGGRSTRM
jgi:hypothetical protein